jgi:hypothetical protein
MSQTSLMGMPLRPNQEPLSIVTELVFQTLADRVPGRERDWAHGLARALERAETALAYHLAALEEPEGDFAKLETGTAVRQAANIYQSQAKILREWDNLRIDAEQAAAAFTDRASSARRISGSTNQASWREIPDFGILRKRANELLDRLRDSCAAELRLVMDGVNTDIGGGD